MGSELGTQSGRVRPPLTPLRVRAAAGSLQACRALSRGAGNEQVSGHGAGNPVRVLGLQFGGGHGAPSWARDAGVLSPTWPVISPGWPPYQVWCQGVGRRRRRWVVPSKKLVGGFRGALIRAQGTGGSQALCYYPSPGSMHCLGVCPGNLVVCQSRHSPRVCPVLPC